MQTLFIDCFSGISGDMLLGGFVDLGIAVEEIESVIQSLLPYSVSLSAQRVTVNGISATDVTINSLTTPPLRHLSHITELIASGSLDHALQEQAIAVFRRIGEAEAAIHGIPLESVHFHEIGAVDTIADIIGCLYAWRKLGSPVCCASPVPLSLGLIPMQHGLYPSPAPATARLLEGVPCYGVDSDIELVTPTGAALLTELASQFGPIPPMTIGRTAYGAGKKRRPDIPNVIRLIGGDPLPNCNAEQIAVIETSIDDMSPEIYSYLFERFFATPGALDFAVHPIFMKKNRPAQMIQWLVRPDAVQTFLHLLLNETSTLGARYRIENRVCVPRDASSVETQFGDVSVKVWTDPGGMQRYSPEYESCRLIALRQNIPLKAVIEAVSTALSNQARS